MRIAGSGLFTPCHTSERVERELGETMWLCNFLERLQLKRTMETIDIPVYGEMNGKVIMCVTFHHISDQNCHF